MTGRRTIAALVFAIVTFARLTATAPPPAEGSASDDERADVREALTRMIEIERRPALNDPAWVTIQTELDADVAAHPDGASAALARRAAARMEMSATPLVATAPHTSPSWRTPRRTRPAGGGT